MWHIDSEILANAFRGGRFKSEPTIAFTTLEHDDFFGEQFAIQHVRLEGGTPPKYQTFEAGFCRRHDFTDIFALATQEGDTHKTNPNLQVFESALRQMDEFASHVPGILAAEQRLHAEKVVSFADFHH